MSELEIMPYTSHGNDLFCEVGKCNCDYMRYGKNNEYSIKETVKLSGYNDNYFFLEVNKDFKNFNCKNCGYSFKYKWTPVGVEIKDREFLEITNA